MAKKYTNRQIIAPIIIIFFIAIITILVFRLITHSETEQAINSDSPSQSSQQVDAPSQEESESSDVTLDDNSSSEDDLNHGPVQYEGSDPNSLAALTGVVSFAGVQEDHLLINIVIDQSLTDGTCLIQIGDFTTSVDIELVTSYSSCSFQIPTSNFQTGNYPFSVKLTSGDKTGTITSEVDI